MHFEGVSFRATLLRALGYFYCRVLSFSCGCCITTSGVSRVEGRARTSLVGLKCDLFSDIFVFLSLIFRHASQFLTRSRRISIQETLRTGPNHETSSVFKQCDFRCLSPQWTNSTPREAYRATSCCVVSIARTVGGDGNFVIV
jgi:hypothetical protein